MIHWPEESVQRIFHPYPKGPNAIMHCTFWPLICSGMAQVDEDDSTHQESEEGSRGPPNKKSNSQYKANGHGMLYHYVDKAEHIMKEETNQNDAGNCVDQHDEMVSFSSEYIENSLGLLDCTELNPYNITTTKTISMFEVNGEDETNGNHSSNSVLDNANNEESNEPSITCNDRDTLNRELLTEEDTFTSMQEFYDDSC